ncbi:MAG: 2-C-methyl-D-erythritol 2,4-cyclodiphosphate synthase [Syntrophorhabdus sp. PtaU1.Bin050]|jgi:2-C-methyl-D-erythritol 2,4-cyclodiphosphate synthase|nr:MAG: 2-C-methyl-D-erythritol 2,4-cyclodiphosphate synthase [Syntrophorhabdus sp. PtaU1.Bin050]
MRVGVGYDVHRLVEGRKLFLGGIEVPFSKGLLGHSDGDVLIHAICDAILGAISEGDIGVHFPDSDRTTEGIRSTAILSHVMDLTKKKGYAVVNIDTVVAAEEPKIQPLREAMKKALAETMGVSADRIGIKGKTTESLGFVGKKEGIEVYAVALLEEKDESI